MKIFISDLKNYVNKNITISLLLNELTVSENRHKNKWMELICQDKTGEISLKVWDEQIDQTYYGLKGKVITVTGTVGLYQNRPDIKVLKIEEEREYDWRDFVLSISQETAQNYSERLLKYIQCVSNDSLKALLELIISNGRFKKMAEAVGGTLHHHYLGGLLVHTVDTCDFAYFLAKRVIDGGSPYGTFSSVNVDLVITGALLHDIGKLSTYSFPYGEKNDRGFLVGSSAESLLYATVYNSMLPADKRVDDLAHLNHILLTAETVDETGPKPRTIEAVIVNEANRQSMNTDGFITAFTECEKKCNSNGKKYVYSKINQTTIIRG